VHENPKSKQPMDRSLSSMAGAVGLLIFSNWPCFSAFSAEKTLAAAVDTKTLWDHEPSLLFLKPSFNWAHDPFRKKPGYSVNSFTEPQFTLAAVIYEGADSEALINGRRVRVGDEIGGRIIEEIGPNYVLLSKDDSVLELNLPTSEPDTGVIQLEEVQDAATERGKP